MKTQLHIAGLFLVWVWLQSGTFHASTDSLAEGRIRPLQLPHKNSLEKHSAYLENTLKTRLVITGKKNACVLSQIKEINSALNQNTQLQSELIGKIKRIEIKLTPRSSTVKPQRIIASYYNRKSFTTQTKELSYLKDNEIHPPASVSYDAMKKLLRIELSQTSYLLEETDHTFQDPIIFNAVTIENVANGAVENYITKSKTTTKKRRDCGPTAKIKLNSIETLPPSLEVTLGGVVINY